MSVLRKRNCRVEVCFTKDELTVLSKKAKKAGLSIGGFVRRSVADKEIKEAPPSDIPCCFGPCGRRIQSGSDLEEIQHHQCAGYAAVSEGIGGNQSRHENGV